MDDNKKKKVEYRRKRWKNERIREHRSRWKEHVERMGEESLSSNNKARPLRRKQKYRTPKEKKGSVTWRKENRYKLQQLWIHFRKSFSLILSWTPNSQLFRQIIYKFLRQFCFYQFVSTANMFVFHKDSLVHNKPIVIDINKLIVAPLALKFLLTVFHIKCTWSNYHMLTHAFQLVLSSD